MHKKLNSLKIFFRLLSTGKFKYIYCSLRRRYLIFFRPAYVDNQLKARKGKFTKNGCCCKTTTNFCPYLENTQCRIYDNAPFFCKIFPIDEKDKDLADVKKKCGYYWEGSPKLKK